jgi:hypothetical protein
MKKFSCLLALALTAAALLALAGCVTASSINGTADMHGLFSGGEAKTAVTGGAQEIASYSVILGLVDSGYAAYAARVNEALAGGKTVTTTQTWLLFMIKYTAYAQ